VITLTREEREKFAAFLEQDAASGEDLIAQMEKIPTPEALIKKYRTEALAQRIVAKMLRATEDATL
jgi:hypothetical protein